MNKCEGVRSWSRPCLSNVPYIAKSTPDFSLWEHVKNLVSAEEIQVDINHLRQWIIACVATITPRLAGQVM